MCTETELKSFLHSFFNGLDSGLKSLKEIRAVYDERVAFDFCSVRFFWPNENKISEILAFFLDPDKSHGQKTAFLRVFLEHFNLLDAVKLLDEKKEASVCLEDPTDEKRRIDITVKIGDEFILAIENKIYDNTPDQDCQLAAYATDLEKKVGKNYILFYLTPDGHEPPQKSLSVEQRQNLEDKFACIAYADTIIPVFSKFELVCRADNVRAFIKDFQQYLKQQYTGEKTMDEQKFVKEFLENNPWIIKYTSNLHKTAELIRIQQFHLFWSKVAGYAKNERRKLQIDKLNWVYSASGWEGAIVKYDDSSFDSVDLCMNIVYEPSKQMPIYICFKLHKERKDLSQLMSAKVERLETKLKGSDFMFLKECTNNWWCGSVSLLSSFLWKDEHIEKIIKDKELLDKDALKVAEMISKYVDFAESA